MTTFPPLLEKTTAKNEEKWVCKVKKVNNVNLFSCFNNITLLPKV